MLVMEVANCELRMEVYFCESYGERTETWLMVS